jgi:hypothetical protein
MASSLVALITLVALGVWHIRIRTSCELVHLSRWTVLHHYRLSGRCHRGVLVDELSDNRRS